MSHLQCVSIVIGFDRKTGRERVQFQWRCKRFVENQYSGVLDTYEHDREYLGME
jgi:hypothetical protein